MLAPRYFGSKTAMSRALDRRGELTAEGKAAVAAAYVALFERMAGPSQVTMGAALGVTQAAISKAKKGTAGRAVGEAIAAKLGLDLEGLVAKYGPAAPELLRFRDARYPNLEKASAMAMAELGQVLDEVYEERGHRDDDATVDEWLRLIRSRHQKAGRAPRGPQDPKPDVGGPPDMPWKKK